MKLRTGFVCMVVLFAMAASVGIAAQDQSAQFAVGTVFEDANRNGTLDPGEKGIGGVRVSNGRTSVKTSYSGRYRIAVNNDTIIFVIKPRNWQTPVDKNNVPRFYYIHKPAGSPKSKVAGVAPTGPLPASVDFPLYRHPEPDQFRAVFLGDTQVASEEEIGYLAHDIIEELVGTDAGFAVSLGDIVFDRLNLYEPLVGVMGRMGIGCHYVKGNHDTNYDNGPGQVLADETFERVFGPSYYSYDYGPVHFIALNNPYFLPGGQYEGRLDPEQMEFLRDDLASIPKNQLVVLMMHIPINEMKDKDHIYELLQTHPNLFAIAAHWHTQRHFFLGKADGWNGANPLHLLVNVTSCGNWWGGKKDELGIPDATMADGVPNGYSIISFDGPRYSIRYKAARRPDNYQMDIKAPDVVIDNGKITTVSVNVFGGSELSTVDMQVHATYQRMTPDPKTPHTWYADLPQPEPGTYLIQVQHRDMFGHLDEGYRVITIEPYRPGAGQAGR